MSDDQVKQAVYDEVGIGVGVIIAFGTKGEQYAHGLARRGYRADGGKTKGVRVWRASTKRWTKPRTLQPGEVIRLATQADYDRFAPDFGVPWDRD